MPRGKRTVYTMTCANCRVHAGTVRLHKQNSKGVAWKDFDKKSKYCQKCCKRVEMKLKEERHSK